MKKLLGVLLSLCMVMCFMPSLAFAGSTETTLEMSYERSGASLGNYFKAEAGSSLSIYLFHVNWYENGNTSKKLIKAKKNYIKITDSLDKVTKNISVAVYSDGKVKLGIKNSCIFGTYNLSYKNKQINLIVLAKPSDIIVKKNVTGLKALSVNDGIKLSWNKNLGDKTSGFEIYRSKYANKGFKLLDFTIDPKEKNYTDNWKLEAGKTYYYKVRGIQYMGDTYDIYKYSKFSKVVKASAPFGEVQTIAGIKAETVEDGIKISWDNDFGDSINGFDIYRSTKADEGFEKVCFEYDAKADTYMDKWGLEAGKTYYYKVRAVQYLGYSNRYSKWSDTVYASSNVNAVDTIVNHTNSLSLQEIFMIPNVKKLIKNPKKEEDYLNNIMYSFMNGNYALNYKFNSKTAAQSFSNKIIERVDLIAAAYPDLCGIFMNVINYTESIGKITKSGSKYVFTLKLKGMPLSDKEIYSNKKAAIKVAKQIYIDLHKTGKITEEMNEKEKVIAISQYLLSRKISIANGGEPNCPPMQNAVYDSAYANLVAKKGCCGSWASAFNLVAHIEGIYSNGVTTLGHITNRIVVDGTEYFHDTGWGSYLNSYNAFNKMSKFEQKPLKYVREHSVKYEVATENAA